MMLTVIAVITAVVSGWLMKPIRRLSNATKQFANGNLEKRVKINGEDELAMLSEDFNVMAEKSEISRITEAFYMVDKSRARSQGGAGLGLSICSDIVKLHEGTLAFNSRLGLGTCAIIKLKGENAKCQN